MTDKNDSGQKPGRKRLSPKARRVQLLDHAVSAFASAGIERAVHADVAALAGVSTPTVFKYFPNRDALVDAVLSKIEETMTDLLMEVPEGANLSPAEMTHRIAGAIGTLCKNEPDLMKVVLAWSVAFTPVRDRYVRFKEDKLDMFHARISHTGADRSDSIILLGITLLYIRMHFDGSTKDIRARYIRRLIQVLESAPP